MANKNRKKRIEQYQNQSNEADFLAAIGNTKEALSLLTELEAQAKTAGDEDFRLFFEAEKIGYSDPDFSTQIKKLKEALQWTQSKGLPTESFLIRQLGVYHSLHDREEEAIALFDQALAINPKDYVSLRNKGVSLSELDREEEAIALFDQALAINPKDYDALRQKGVSLSKLDRCEEAIALFDQALAINPKDYDALRQKGVSLSKLDREGEAIALFDQALAINPKDYDALRNKGVSLSKLDRCEEAIALFDQALAINPKDYVSLRQKGVSLSKLDREGEAIALYDQALAINPKDYDALRQKGVSLSKLDREEEAIALYDQAIAINPKDAASYRCRSASKYHLEKYDLALADIKQAVILQPEEYKEDFRLLVGLIGREFETEWKSLEKELHSEDKYHIASDSSKTTSHDSLKVESLIDIRGFVGHIRKALGNKGTEFLEEIKKANAKEVEFLEPDSLLNKDLSFMLTLRKWNSYRGCSKICVRFIG